MGVRGLWSLVEPAARPTQLESLRQKRIAVDASIWIHQFMRTMRDKEGNALRNGHLLGFFRRICKLLFFDIKPVFVFDGGAPTLKRSTIRERRKRREGIKANLKATARKILSAQVKSRVLYQEEKKLRGNKDTADENYVYYDQLETSAALEALRKKRKMDQFELPQIQQSETDARLQKLDPRFASSEEIQDFVNEFKPTEQDIDSEAFLALPPEVQYEVIQDMMWKSRSTSWARLDEMVRGSNTALDFSKHQIKLLKHRNAMTQRLILASSAQSGVKLEPARIAGERGRQYILYKNEDLNQGLGWKLPGLSAAEPVNLLDDTTSSRPEPRIEVPVEKEGSPTLASQTEDKVAAAMASNPKLAALFDNFLSDDDEEEDEFESIDTAIPKMDEPIDDDAPLFLSESQDKDDLVNDMGAYVYDDEDDDIAINQMIARMYQTKSTTIENCEASHPSLSADEFYDLWISRVPDAFMYMHSFNDEYKKILKRAIEEQDPDKIKRDLLSVRKQFGKTNEGDELALEALQFKQEFLESVIEWRANQVIQDKDTFEQLDDKPASPVALTEDNIMIDDEEEEEIQFTTGLEQAMIVSDDEDDQDIQFMERAPKTIDPKNQVELSSQEHVHINIHQSTLPLGSALDNDQELVNNNNTKKLELSTKESGPKTDSPRSNVFVLDENPNEMPLEADAEIKTIVESSNTVELDVENTESSKKIEDHGYNSEDELDVQGEEDEYARFVSDIQSKHLDQVRTELYKDMRDLNKQQRKEMGNSDDITDQMVQDIQELLKMFGIPYIVSPMEAEAQCATLETLALVDGTITDDSDVFLFGASRVFKNMFNQQRFIECYVTQDIEREMSLSRKKLIQLAFLLGSDYTEGIPGVGPVAAMEILAEFDKSNPEEVDEEEALQAPLERFKDWYNSGVDNTPFQKKLRKRHNALDIPDDFPNPLVIDAYYYPTVDDSTQRFEWGQPQLDSLRIFLMEAFGWSEEKADQVLLPVLREMNNKKATGEQSTIGSFFNVSGSVSSNTGHSTQNKHSSKRVQSIVDNWKKQKRSKTQK